MNTSLVSLLAAASITALAAVVAAAEPDSTATPVVVTPESGQAHDEPARGAMVSSTNAILSSPDASPSATPVHHYHHHPSPTPGPSPSPTPKKHWFWQKSGAPKSSPTPKATPKATPRPTPKATPVPKATPEPKAVAKAEPSATPETTPHIHHATATPSPSPSPKHKGKSFWILFKHHGKKAAPAPSPSPTPHRHHAAPEATESPSPAGAENTPSVNTAPPPAAEATPTPEEKSNPGGLNSQVPFVPPAAQPEKAEAPVVETKTPAEEEAEESAHFHEAKDKALQDPHLQELQNAADSATGDDAKAAMRRYYKALYEKMRDIDPSIKDRIDRTEAATMRRVEAANPQ